MDLKRAAEQIAGGDFKARTSAASHDEIGKLSAAFNKMAESLQREEELRKHLFSNIAHELRTPLTILKTHAEAIADGVIEREKGLENIKNEIDRLIKLVKGIEDITMAEASFFTKGETAEINLREFLSGICNEMLPAFKQKNLDIKILREDDLFISTDIEKLERIARNIISNSLKFTEKGGVSIDYGTEGKMFFIEIRDSGRGMPENEIPLIFNRFYRGAKSDTESLGLGLAIVKELVEVMAGRVEVKSTIDEGTTFRVYLPLKSA
jgi:signal transduction histidine kinase